MMKNVTMNMKTCAMYEATGERGVLMLLMECAAIGMKDTIHDYTGDTGREDYT